MLETYGQEREFQSKEVVTKALPNMNYFIEIKQGKVREMIEGNTIREFKKDEIFAVHYSQMLSSSFVAVEDNTILNFFDIISLHNFFLKNPIIGKKFYQNNCIYFIFDFIFFIFYFIFFIFYFYYFNFFIFYIFYFLFFIFINFIFLFFIF
jgi:hypothetical protein